MVSGASRGIGRSIAESLLEHGFKISLGVRNPECFADTRFTGHQDVLISHYDATDKDGAEQWVQKTIKYFGRIDGVVNNAGIFRSVSIEKGDEADLDAMWEVNVKGPWRLLRATFPWLKKSNHGRIINVVSLSGKRLRTVGTTWYAMSKFAARALHQGCRMAGWEHGIRATAICTSYVETDMASNIKADLPSGMTAPEDVANAVLFLLSQPDRAAINELSINCSLEPEH